jgi:hypothetical protein
MSIAVSVKEGSLAKHVLSALISRCQLTLMVNFRKFSSDPYQG